MFSSSGGREAGDFAGASAALMLFGVIVAIAGVLILIWPGFSLVTIAVIFALQLLVMGVFRIVSAITTQDATGGARALMAVLGVLAIVVGILFLRHPFQTIATLVLLVGLFWVISGVLETVHAASTPDLPGRGWGIAGGLISLLAGIVMLSLPAIGVVVLIWLLGIELVIYGATSIARGVRVRRLEHGGAGLAPPPAHGGAAPA